MEILGINFSNDSAAAFVRDGDVVAAVAEERFSRRKHDPAFPNRAVAYCLEAAGHSPGRLDEVDAVALFWNPGRHLESPNRRQSGSIRHHQEYLTAVPNNLIPSLGRGVTRVEQRFHLSPHDGLGRGGELRVVYLDHHLAHAAAALVRSNFEQAAILTVDGYGERTSTFIADGDCNRVNPLLQIEFPHSLGSLYAAVTEYLGFRANSGEGKVMGLASYGEPRFAKEFRSLVRLTDDGFRIELAPFAYYIERPTRVAAAFHELFGPPRSPESEIEPRHMDIAASLQLVTEDALVHLARLAKARSGRRRLVMAGGVTLNCVANTRILAEAGFDECFFLPASGDSGTSLGAALALCHMVEDQPRRTHPATDYLGPEFTTEMVRAGLARAGVAHFEQAEVASRAAAHGLPAQFHDAVATLIAGGHIVGWFQGRAEFGPRALGNRSILADPRRPEMKDVLNARVKFREWFRPFAPSVLESRVGDLFDCETPSPYMLRVYQTQPRYADFLSSITHVDGGARVQTVNHEQNPRYAGLIQAFERLTGVPCLLNTSFNIRGEPIVNDVSDALKCFFTTDMDFLAVGDFILEKRPGLLERALAGDCAPGFAPLPRFGV